METKQPVGKERLLSGVYFVVFIANVIVGVMLQSYNSTISLQIDAMGFPASMAGMTIFMGMPASFAMYFFGGRVNNRIGRRKTAVLGLLLYSMCNLLCGFAADVGLLLVSRFFMMMGYGMASSALSVMITDIVPRSRLTEGVGYFGLGTSLSSAFAPSIALALFATAGAYRTVMSFVAGIGVLAILLLLLFCRYEKKSDFQGRLQADIAAVREKQGNQVRGIWGFLERSAIPPTLLALGSTMGMSILTMYVTHFAKQAGIPNPGWYFTFSAFGMVISRLSMGRLVDRRGAAVCVLPGIGLSTAAMLLMPLTPNFHFLLYAAGVLNGVGQGMAVPALNSAAVLAARPERRSYASSTFMLQYSMGFGLGSLMWGFLIDIFSYQRCFLIGGCILVGIFAAAAFYFLKRGKRDDKSE